MNQAEGLGFLSERIDTFVVPPSLDSVIVGAACEQALLRVPNGLVNGSPMPRKLLQNLARLVVKNVHVTVLGAADDGGPVGPEADADQVFVGVLVALEPFHGLGSFQIPYPIGIILGAAQKHGPRQVHLDRGDFAQMLGEGLDAGAADNVPELDRVVLGSADDYVSVRVERDAAYGGRVTNERSDEFPGPGIEQPDHFVETAAS